jgi:hypothetical protein
MSTDTSLTMSWYIRGKRKQTLGLCYLRRNAEVHQNPFVGWLVLGAPGPAPGLIEPGEPDMALWVPVCRIAGAGRKLPVVHRSGHQSQRSRTRSCETQLLVTTSVRCLYNLHKWTRLKVIDGLQLHLALELTLKIVVRNTCSFISFLQNSCFAWSTNKMYILSRTAVRNKLILLAGDNTSWVVSSPRGTLLCWQLEVFISVAIYLFDSGIIHAAQIFSQPS